MKHRSIGLLIALLLAWAGAVGSSQAPAPAANRFEAEFAKFDEADRVSPPPADAVVFTGSSSIRLWSTLAQDFPGVHTLNRGFGGSEIEEAIRNVDRLVLRYKPSRVVFYSGDNDLNSGKSPEAVAADYKAFVDAVHAKLPAARIAIIAIKPSLARWALFDKMRDTNSRVNAMVARDPKRLTFVDIVAPMLGPDGKPRPELYVEDGLHMTPAGYAIWKEKLAPFLK